MPKIIAATLLLSLLAACSDEAEIVVVEGVEESEVDYSLTDAEPTPWDLDDDGLLNQSEYLGLSDTAFVSWDADQDGSLSASEFDAGWTEVGFTDAAGAFAVLDVEEDGVLTRPDFLGATLWERWDADRSGVLEAEEFPYYQGL